ncbi:MAG: single-stranded DNA-binding protein [Mucilaginibacter sp.]
MYNNASINKVFLIGRITREPRLHHSKNEKVQLSFTLTSTEIVKTQGRDIEHNEVHHIRISADNSCLKNLKLTKGDMLYIQGKLQTHTFIDEEQIKRYKTEIIASNIELF